jgi:hypothetical protein
VALEVADLEGLHPLGQLMALLELLILEVVVEALATTVALEGLVDLGL